MGLIAGRLYVATGDSCLGLCSLGILETIRGPAFELSGHRTRKVYTSRYKWRIHRVTTWCLNKVSYLGAATLSITCDVPMADEMA